MLSAGRQQEGVQLADTWPHRVRTSEPMIHGTVRVISRNEGRAPRGAVLIPGPRGSDDCPQTSIPPLEWPGNLHVTARGAR